ncbi:MAG: hypothetical protein HC892_17855 [Saprospiraceae bacterium]|nr:hypothetical protein [Saprospiraceae bacterium]
MNDKHIDKLLARIERECRDDLKLVRQFEISYFDTHYLEELYKQWKQLRANVHRSYEYLVAIVATAPIFILLSGIGEWLEISWLSAFIFGFPISILAFLVGMIVQHKKHGSLKQYERTGAIVRSELQRRHDKMYI